MLVLLGAIASSLGVICTIFYFVSTRRWARSLAEGSWVDGVVVEHDLASEDGKLIVEYEHPRGSVRQTWSAAASSFWPKQGARARVLVPPDDEAEAQIEVVVLATHRVFGALAIALTLIGAALQGLALL